MVYNSIFTQIPKSSGLYSGACYIRVRVISAKIYLLISNTRRVVLPLFESHAKVGEVLSALICLLLLGLEAIGCQDEVL